MTKPIFGNGAKRYLPAWVQGVDTTRGFRLLLVLSVAIRGFSQGQLKSATQPFLVSTLKTAV